MNFWIFSSNKQVIAYGKNPVLKAINSTTARMIVSELNIGAPKTLKLSENGKSITKDGENIATIIGKNDFIKDLFNPKAQPIPITFEPIIEEMPEEANLKAQPIPITFEPIIEEMPEEEIQKEEVPVGIPEVKGEAKPKKKRKYTGRKKQ